jgi:hypothetical protein
MQHSKLPLHLSPRCLARTRSGKPRQSPAMKGKKRCRMHGGKLRGGPPGNQHALRTGRHTAEPIMRRCVLAALVANAKKLAEEIE